MQLLDRPIINRTPALAWSELIEFPTLELAVQRVATSYDFDRHPYLIWMQDPATERDSFCSSQLPFRFAVESFSQALAAVLARIPTLADRLPLFANLVEEHGRGNVVHSHKFTFQAYLLALGANEADFYKPCPTTVLAFNQSILTYCLTQNPEVGAAMLGIIEHLYIGISAKIARTLDDRQWTLPGSQSHYLNHERLDTEHARDLLTITSPAWNEPRSRAQVSQALVLGAYYFWRLYADL
jgi:pyrroloquinoline-quinone synthase